MADTFTVYGNHGTITVNAETGAIIEITDNRHEVIPTYDGIVITRFDLDEYRKYYHTEPANVDIVDIGYWYRDEDDDTEQYEPAVDELRVG